MTPEERAREVVDTLGIHEGNRNYRYAVREVRERIEAAVAEEREAGMREVNRVFCRGLSSILDLGFMRDMHARVVAAEEREVCARIAEAADACPVVDAVTDEHYLILVPRRGDWLEEAACGRAIARAIRARAEAPRPRRSFLDQGAR